MNHVEAREFAHRMMKSWIQSGTFGYFGHDEWAEWMLKISRGPGDHPNLHHTMQKGDFLETQMKIVAFLTDEGNDGSHQST